MVDIKKVFDALTSLKINHPLYSHIILRNTHSDLRFENLNNAQFEIQEIENSEIASEDEPMLTQVIDENDDCYYKQYTIYLLYAKRKRIKLIRRCIKC